MTEERHPEDTGQLARWKKQQKLERLKKQLERLNGKTYPGDELSGFFHLGTVGHAGRPSARLNRRREAAIETRAADAKTAREVQLKINALTWELNQPPKVKKAAKPVKAKPEPTERERALYEFYYYGGLDDYPPEGTTEDELYAMRMKYRNGMAPRVVPAQVEH
jgi:hypothetical protein